MDKRVAGLYGNQLFSNFYCWLVMFGELTSFKGHWASPLPSQHSSLQEDCQISRNNYLRYAGDLSASQTECNQNINVKIYTYMIYVIIKGDNITNLKNKLTRKCDALMTTRSYPMPRRDAATDDGTSFVCGAIFELDLFVGAFKLEEIEVPENALRPVRNHGQTYG